jgi:Cu(I)/Ag(I) efflux system protein CusF
MTSLKNLLILLTLLTGAASAHAASHAGAPAVAPADMADGEVRKVDKEAQKITIRHGVIKSLDMPAMTMVFQVRKPDLLDKVKAGDKIRFKAQQTGSAMVVTDIEPAN